MWTDSWTDRHDEANICNFANAPEIDSIIRKRMKQYPTSLPLHSCLSGNNEELYHTQRQLSGRNKAHANNHKEVTLHSNFSLICHRKENLFSHLCTNQLRKSKLSLVTRDNIYCDYFRTITHTITRMDSQRNSLVSIVIR